MLLLEIRGMTIPYSSRRKKTNNERFTHLENQIKLLNDLADSSPTDTFDNMLEEAQKELEELRKEKIKGLMLRARVQWIEDGEKPTIYFCSLEKRNFINKTLMKIINDKGEEITQQQDILNEITMFYSNLYSSQDDLLEDVKLDNLLKDYQITKLTNEDREMIEGTITYQEASLALKRMKNDKSPGPDGFIRLHLDVGS